MTSPTDNNQSGQTTSTEPKSPKPRQPSKVELKIKRAVTVKGRMPRAKDWVSIGASAAKALSVLGSNVESIGILKTTQGGWMVSQAELARAIVFTSEMTRNEDLDAATKLEAARTLGYLVRAQAALVKSTCEIQKLNYHVANPLPSQKKSFRPLQVVGLVLPPEKKEKSITVECTRMK